MKKQIKSFISGVVITTVAFTSILTVSAKTGNQTVEVAYKNIKMYLNGSQINSSEEPFVLNGSTYVPLRTVSESLGANVTWDGNTNSIYMSTEGEEGVPVFMEEISPIDGNWDSINAHINHYDILNPSSRNLVGMSKVNTNSVESNPITYKLDGKYDRFTCTLSNKFNMTVNGFSYDMLIYGDDVLLYETPNSIKKGNKIDVDIDISGVNNLKFVARWDQDSDHNYFDDVVVFDPTLY